MGIGCPARRVAGDRGRSSEPLLQKVVHQVLEARLRAVVVIVVHEDEPVSRTDRNLTTLHCSECRAEGISLDILTRIGDPTA